MSPIHLVSNIRHQHRCNREKQFLNGDAMQFILQAEKTQSVNSQFKEGARYVILVLFWNVTCLAITTVKSLDVSRSSSLFNIWIDHLSVLNKHVQIIPQGFDIRHCQFLLPVLRIEKTTVEFLRTGFIKRVDNLRIEKSVDHESQSFLQVNKRGRF